MAACVGGRGNPPIEPTPAQGATFSASVAARCGRQASEQNGRAAPVQRLRLRLQRGGFLSGLNVSTTSQLM